MDICVLMMNKMVAKVVARASHACFDLLGGF